MRENWKGRRWSISMPIDLNKDKAYVSPTMCWGVRSRINQNDRGSISRVRVSRPVAYRVNKTTKMMKKPNQVKNDSWELG